MFGIPSQIGGPPDRSIIIISQRYSKLCVMLYKRMISKLMKTET
jgi:hypothetical protein